MPLIESYIDDDGHEHNYSLVERRGPWRLFMCQPTCGYWVANCVTRRELPRDGFTTITGARRILGQVAGSRYL